MAFKIRTPFPLAGATVPLITTLLNSVSPPRPLHGNHVVTPDGDLGKGKPRMEIWFDRFSGYQERKLYAGFYTTDRPQILTITKQVSKKLWPVCTFTTTDLEEGDYLSLAIRLGRSEFNAPLLENCGDGETFYGFCDPTRETTERVNPHFCSRAVVFFEDVARAMPEAKAEDEEREVFPRFENRKTVASHIRRERSKLLAAECKIRDDYRCQVCGLNFEETYGKLGREFAEAHHLQPLASLRENVRTDLKDLATVCAYCHRMLHRMEGVSGDIQKLKAIYRRLNR